MSLETIREGVTFRDDAARSFRRLEAEVGTIRCNSTFRDPELQQRMHDASVAYENGTGPYPGHSWAADPDDSEHCKGLAFDANRAYSIRPAAWRHGWRWVTRANEEHHLEYKPWLDEYRYDPAPAAVTEPPKPKEWEDMATKQEMQEAFIEALRQSNRENVDKSVTVSINPPDDGSDDQVWYAVDFDAGTMYRLWNGVQLDVRRDLGLRELVNQPPQLLDGIRDTSIIP
ncbi:M15 family metallopeptidase [Microbacterium sp. Leaf179]|uniref:M15 family metallopeptidase n=1 Tax=Microbacterium sp. Leaf179 TaxID=1736288 RepID=UPI0006F33059|nr:M15 family metallopeptidase [Microbacterium sp. Leaf179]KQR86823.1 hypothetical protein ASF96_10950 [Microbacterium sp. Leaf179]